jgi:hypothetical protein
VPIADAIVVEIGTAAGTFADEHPAAPLAEIGA